MQDEVKAEVRRLRSEEGLSVAQLSARTGVGPHRVRQWLAGIAVPAWTRRPNAKDELRARAEQLRGAGWSVPRIATELGVARSTAYEWVRRLPLGSAPEQVARRRAHAKLMTDARWAAHRVSRDQARRDVAAAAGAWVDQLSERETLLLGAAVYWCEGAKAKPWRPNDCRLKFVNSDPVLVELFLRCVELLGVARADLRYRVSIHETADATAASRWWAAAMGVSLEAFLRPTLKRHRPVTRRQNTGEEYRGCLMVEVPRSGRLYWWIEGAVTGIAGAAVPEQDGKV